jgi:Flp pilus assembly protein TadB
VFTRQPRSKRRNDVRDAMLAALCAVWILLWATGGSSVWWAVAAVALLVLLVVDRRRRASR